MKQRLLLHSCCGPCSSGVLEDLSKDFDVTIFYYNPNIYPKEEYEKRRDTQKQLLEELKPNINVGFVELPYDENEYLSVVEGLENEKEGGARCEKCFLLRMGKTALFAKENGYDLFTTTLSVSPHKNAKLLNEIGEILEKKYAIKYLVADFKKKNGYLKSIQNSKKYNLYRQNYCGCKFSIWF